MTNDFRSYNVIYIVYSRKNENHWSLLITHYCEFRSLGFCRGSDVECQMSRVEGKKSRVEGKKSRVEGKMSRVEGKKSRVESRGSRVKCRGSRVKCRGSRVKSRGSKEKVEGRKYFKDSGFYSTFYFYYWQRLKMYFNFFTF